MENTPKKSKAFIITLIAVCVLLVFGYILFSHKDTLFSTKGTTTTNNKTFVPLDTTPKQTPLTTIDGVPVTNITPNMTDNGSNITLTVEAGEDISRGDAVYSASKNANGQDVIFRSLASDPMRAHVLGVADEDIKKGNTGKIVIAGIVRGLAQTIIDGTNLQIDELLYLGDKIPGQTAINIPAAPSVQIVVATILQLNNTINTVDIIIGNHINDKSKNGGSGNGAGATFTDNGNGKGNVNQNGSGGGTGANGNNGSGNGAGATFLDTLSNIARSTINGIGNFFGSLFGNKNNGGNNGGTLGSGTIGSGNGLGSGSGTGSGGIGGTGGLTTTGGGTGTGFGTGSGTTGGGFGSGSGLNSGGLGTGGGLDSGELGIGSGSGGGTGDGFGSGGFDLGTGDIGSNPLPTPDDILIDYGSGGGSGGYTGGGTGTGGGQNNCVDANGDPIPCDNTNTLTTATVEMCPSDDPLVFTDIEKAQLDALLKKYYLIAPSLKSDEDIKIINDDILRNKSIIEQATSLIDDCKAQKADPHYTGPQSIRDNPYYSAPTQIVVTPILPTNPTDCVDQTSNPLNGYFNFNDPSSYFSNLYNNNQNLLTDPKPCKPNSYYGQNTGTTTNTVTIPGVNADTYLPGKTSEYMTDVKTKRNGVPIDGSGYTPNVKDPDGKFNLLHHPVLDYSEFEALFHIW